MSSDSDISIYRHDLLKDAYIDSNCTGFEKATDDNSNTSFSCDDFMQFNIDLADYKKPNGITLTSSDKNLSPARVQISAHSEEYGWETLIEIDSSKDFTNNKETKFYGIQNKRLFNKLLIKLFPQAGKSSVSISELEIYSL